VLEAQKKKKKNLGVAAITLSPITILFKRALLCVTQSLIP
jgi:hypothetical protein